MLKSIAEKAWRASLRPVFTAGANLASDILLALIESVDGSRTKPLLLSSLALALGLYFATIGGHEWSETGWYRVQSKLKGTDIVVSDDVKQGHEMNRNRQIAGWVFAAFGLLGFIQLWRARHDMQPVVTFRVTPIFPSDLKSKRIKGDTLVEFIVEENGTVLEPRVVRATAPEFGEAALAAVTRWRFSPAIKRGVPVRTRMQVPIAFKPS